MFWEEFIFIVFTFNLNLHFIWSLVSLQIKLPNNTSCIHSIQLVDTPDEYILSRQVIVTTSGTPRKAAVVKVAQSSMLYISGLKNNVEWKKWLTEMTYLSYSFCWNIIY